jgi:hypothetical protein
MIGHLVSVRVRERVRVRFKANPLLRVRDRLYLRVRV